MELIPGNRDGIDLILLPLGPNICNGGLNVVTIACNKDTNEAVLPNSLKERCPSFVRPIIGVAKRFQRSCGMVVDEYGNTTGVIGPCSGFTHVLTTGGELLLVLQSPPIVSLEWVYDFIYDQSDSAFCFYGTREKKASRFVRIISLHVLLYMRPWL